MTIAAVSATPSAIRKYNRHVIAVHQEQIRDSIRSANMDTAIYYFRVIMEDVSSIMTSQAGQAKDILEIKDSQEKLKTYMETKAANKEDLKQVYRIFEKKNE